MLPVACEQLLERRLRVAGAQVERSRPRRRRSGGRGRGRAPPSPRAAAGAAAGAPASSRTVSCGSSTSTVPVPTSIVSHSAAEPVGVEPGGRGWRPSGWCRRRPRCGRRGWWRTSRSRTGRRCSTAKVQTRFSARASSASSPVSTSTPAARRVSAPPTATGFGSGCATTTRRTPAPTRAWEHGPVRPVWLQGSSVTTAVAPAGRATDPGERVDLGVRRTGSAVVALGERRARRRRAGRSRLAGSARVVRRRVAASARARRIAVRSVSLKVIAAPPVGSRTPGQRVDGVVSTSLDRRGGCCPPPSPCVRFPSGL